MSGENEHEGGTPPSHNPYPAPSSPQPSWQAPPPPPGPEMTVPIPPGPGMHQQPYPARQTTNGLAIASLVLGIVWIYWIGSILALIFGYVARKQIDASQGWQGGRGMATAGIVLGWVGVGFLLLAMFIGFIGFIGVMAGL